MQQDEDIYTFFEPELPFVGMDLLRTKVTDGIKFSGERRFSPKITSNKNGTKSSQCKAQQSPPKSQKKYKNHVCGAPKRPEPEKISFSVLDLKKENYFSCAVGRTRTNARYKLGSSDDVVAFLKELADATALTLKSSN